MRLQSKPSLLRHWSPNQPLYANRSRIFASIQKQQRQLRSFKQSILDQLDDRSDSTEATDKANSHEAGVVAGKSVD